MRVTRERSTQPGFEDLVDALKPDLLRAAWLLTSNKWASEDLVQETLIELLIAVRRKKVIENPVGFARTILFRKFASSKRLMRNQEIPYDEIPEPFQDLTSFASRSVTALVVNHVLKTLSLDDRAVLILRYYYDLDSEEIGRIVGISAGAARTRTTRAKARLQMALIDRGVSFEFGD